MKVLMIILMFLVIGSLLVINNNGLVLAQSENFEEFANLYVGWINKVASNINNLTGNIIRLDWGTS